MLIDYERIQLMNYLIILNERLSSAAAKAGVFYLAPPRKSGFCLSQILSN